MLKQTIDHIEAVEAWRPPEGFRVQVVLLVGDPKVMVHVIGCCAFVKFSLPVGMPAAEVPAKLDHAAAMARSEIDLVHGVGADDPDCNADLREAHRKLEEAIDAIAAPAQA